MTQSRVRFWTGVSGAAGGGTGRAAAAWLRRSLTASLWIEEKQNFHRWNRAHYHGNVSYLLWNLLNFWCRHCFTYCWSRRSVDGFSTSKSISISSGLDSHMEGSSVWIICTTRPSFLPGKRLISKLSWCFSSYVNGGHLSSGSQVFNFLQGFLEFITEQSKSATLE